MATGLIIREATAIVNCTAWRMFAQECEIPYPGDFCSDLIRVFTPSMSAAKKLYKEKRERLALACQNWEQSMVEIFWSSNHHPIPIAAASNSSQLEGSTIMSSSNIPTSIPILFGNCDNFVFSKVLLDTMGRILESEKPVAMVRLRDQKQVFLNRKFSDMLATPPEIATGRSMKLGWNPAHLEECNRRIRQEGRFEFTYDSALNPKTYGRQTAVIELIDDGVDQYRLNTNQGLELLEWPEHMKQLMQFDW
jgi:hypothetical protein